MAEKSLFEFGVRAHDYGRVSPEILFETIAKDGFVNAQLAPKKALTGVNALSDVNPGLLERVRNALNKTGMKIGVLGAYIDPALAHEAERGKNVQEFIAALPIAAALGAGCVGTETTLMESQPGVTREHALCQLEKSLAEILPRAEELGVVVAVEPVFCHSMSTPENTRRIISNLASKNLKVIFDPINLLAPELLTQQRALWERSFDCFGEQIVAVHMKGIGQKKNGALVPVPFKKSLLDYEFIFDKLKQLGKTIPVLREEIDPAHAAEDLAFMQQFA